MCSDKTVVKNFLSLPPETLPSAQYVNPNMDDSDCWVLLRDFILPEEEQKYNHIGECMVLRAATAGWKEGVLVNAG